MCCELSKQQHWMSACVDVLLRMSLFHCVFIGSYLQMMTNFDIVVDTLCHHRRDTIESFAAVSSCIYTHDELMWQWNDDDRLSTIRCCYSDAWDCFHQRIQRSTTTTTTRNIRLTRARQRSWDTPQSLIDYFKMADSAKNGKISTLIMFHDSIHSYFDFSDWTITIRNDISMSPLWTTFRTIEFGMEYRIFLPIEFIPLIEAQFHKVFYSNKSLSFSCWC